MCFECFFTSTNNDTFLKSTIIVIKKFLSVLMTFTLSISSPFSTLNECFFTLIFSPAIQKTFLEFSTFRLIFSPFSTLIATQNITLIFTIISFAIIIKFIGSSSLTFFGISKCGTAFFMILYQNDFELL